MTGKETGKVLYGGPHTCPAWEVTRLSQMEDSPEFCYDFRKEINKQEAEPMLEAGR
jgi:hypothetical protein